MKRPQNSQNFPIKSFKSNRVLHTYNTIIYNEIILLWENQLSYWEKFLKCRLLRCRSGPRIVVIVLEVFMFDFSPKFLFSYFEQSLNGLTEFQQEHLGLPRKYFIILILVGFESKLIKALKGLEHLGGSRHVQNNEYFLSTPPLTMACAIPLASQNTVIKGTIFMDRLMDYYTNPHQNLESDSIIKVAESFH